MAPGRLGWWLGPGGCWFGGRLYIATAAVAALCAGTATIAIAPPLRTTLAGQTLKFMGYADVRNLGDFNGCLEASGEVEEG